ncbi:bifunctional DNA primase/polymerase [Actinoallomurus sp. NPDC052308]|uniref:bifunctional DNA primase/polymerase n=1 Tax=Actinoallomurus sp. NPDC052308 TaxID=3155530 RepID=UPI00341516AD
MSDAQALAFIHEWNQATYARRDGKATTDPQSAQPHIPAPEPVATPAALLSAALEAAERGWPVFPVRPGEKRPAFPDHTAARCVGRDPRCRNGHQGWEPRATTDTGRIRRGWATTPYNVGLACGPAGLVVVDLDVPKPGEETPPAEWRAEGVRTGAEVLAVLAARAGEPIGPLFDTYSVITGRGGRHLYFTTPEGVRLGNTAGQLGWLIDTRAHGGYVLAAGSVVAGRPYAVECDRPPAPLPAWLFQRLSRPAPPPQGPVSITTGTGRRSAYLRAALAREVERVTSATEGSRNAALYTAAVALGQLVAGGALTAAEVQDLLEQAAAGHLSARAYTPAEARNTIASGLRAGAKRPRTLAA